MNKPWSHLPNATHIDWVIQTLRSHLKVWNAAHYSTIQIAAWSAAYDAAYNSAPREAARDAACYAAQKAAEDAGRAEALRRADRHWLCPYRHAAPRDSIMALIAYDDAAKYLDMPSDQLNTWAILSEEPAAVLLIPAVIAFERISELETA